MTPVFAFRVETFIKIILIASPDSPKISLKDAFRSSSSRD